MGENAAMLIGSSETGAEEFGHSIVVPINPQSHLMYYLSCVNTLLKSKGEQTDREMKKLCDFKNYSRLSEKEIDRVILMSFLLSPDVLLNKCVFVDDELCKFYDNNFYEINKVSQRFVVTRELLIGGERREVRRIMACRMCWLQENWFSPMDHYKERLHRIVSPGGAGTRQPPRPATSGARQPSRPATSGARQPSRPATSGARQPSRPATSVATSSGASAQRPSTSQGNGSRDDSKGWCTIS